MTEEQQAAKYISGLSTLFKSAWSFTTSSPLMKLLTKHWRSRDYEVGLYLSGIQCPLKTQQVAYKFSGVLQRLTASQPSVDQRLCISTDNKYLRNCKE